MRPIYTGQKQFKEVSTCRLEVLFFPDFQQSCKFTTSQVCLKCVKI